MTNIAEHNGVVDSASGYGQRGRRKPHLNELSKEIQETNGPTLFNTPQLRADGLQSTRRMTLPVARLGVVGGTRTNRSTTH